MNDDHQTQQELASLRQRVAELEDCLTDARQTENELHQQIDRYQTIFDNLPIGITLVDMKAQQGLMRNTAYKTLLGLSLEPLEQPSVADYYENADDSTRVLALLEVDGIVRDYELPLRHKSGSVFCASMSVIPLPYLGDNIVLTMITDITRRKQAEQALKRSEARLRAFANILPDRAVILDAQGVYRDILTTASEREEHSARYLIGKSLHEIYDKTMTYFCQSVIEEVLETNLTQVIEYDFPIEGQLRYLKGYIAPIEAAETGEGQVLWISRNITEYKTSEQRLKYLNRFQSLLMSLATDFINLPINELDTYINRLLEQISKFIGADRSYINLYSADKPTGSRIYEWCAVGVEPRIHQLQDIPLSLYAWMIERLQRFEPFHFLSLDDLPEDAHVVKAVLQSAGIKSGISMPFVHENNLIGELGFQTVYFERDWSEDTVDLLKIAGQIYLNAMKRKKTEDALHTSEASLRKAQQIAHLGSWTWDLQTNKLSWSDEMYRMLGVSKKTAPDMALLQTYIATEDQPLFERALQGYSEASSIEYRIWKNGERRYMVSSITPVFDEAGNEIQLIGTQQDITERKQTEETLRTLNEFQQLITTLATDFINLPVDNVDAEIAKALAQIGEFLLVRSVYVGFYSEDYTLVDKIYLWRKSTREIQIFTQEIIYPWFLEQLKQRNIIQIDDIENLPEEAALEKQGFRTNGVKSIIELPLLVRDRLIGFIAIADKIQSTETLPLLTVAGEIFVNAIKRKQAEDALRESEQQYRNLLEQAPMALVVWKPEEGALKIAYANAAAAVLYGVEKHEQLLGHSFSDFVTEAHYDYLHQERAQDYFEGRDPGFGEYAIRRKDNTNTRFVARSIPIKFEGQSALLTVMRDVTEQRKAEEITLAFQEKLRRVHEIAVELSQEKTLVDIYRRAVELGRSELGFERLGLFLLTPARDMIVGTFGTDDYGQTRDEQHIQSSLEEVFPEVLEVFERKERIIREDGGVIKNPGPKYEIDPTGWNIVAILWNGTEGIGWLCADNYLLKAPMRPYDRDLLTIYATALGSLITQRQVEAELRRYRDHLEELVTIRTAELAAANQELEAFSYTVSHDLRAPLRALNNYSQFIQEDCAGILNDECMEYVEGIAESAQQMERLVGDLLDYSRINRVKVSITEIDVNELLEELVARLQLREQANLSLPSDLPVIRAKRVRLEQIFSNLLTNAVKFRRESIPLTTIVNWSEQPDYWSFSVQDNGIGIAAKHTERIFGIFQRLHTQEEYEGTGIGLAIVDKAVKEHQGQVTVQSQLGSGSTFTFTISKHLAEETA